MVDSLTLFFGAKKKGRKAVKKSPGRKPKRAVKSLPKSKAYITVGGRRRKLYLGKKGGLFYRTKSGRHYVPASVLQRKKHMLSPKRDRKARKSPARKGRKSRFGSSLIPGMSGGYNLQAADAALLRRLKLQMANGGSGGCAPSAAVAQMGDYLHMGDYRKMGDYAQRGGQLRAQSNAIFG